MQGIHQHLRGVLLMYLYCSLVCGLHAQTLQIEEQVDLPALWLGCKDPLISVAQQKACSTPQLLAAIQKQLHYPKEAKNKEIEGLVLVEIVVDSTGQVIQSELLQNIGFGCGKAVLMATKQLPLLAPGEKNGRPVNSKIILPIRFSLSKSYQLNINTKYQLFWGGYYHSQISSTSLEELLDKSFVIRDLVGKDYEVLRVEVNLVKHRSVRMEIQEGNQLGAKIKKRIRRLKKGQVLLVRVYFKQEEHLGEGELMRVYTIE